MEVTIARAPLREPSGAARRRRRTDTRSLFDAIILGLSSGILLLVVAIGILVIALPAAVGGMPLTILTGSMSPSMPPGTLVVVRPTPISDIRPGDVLTYQYESGKPTLVTHRVVARAVDTHSDAVTFVTQGDANPRPDDGEVLPVQVRGTVWFAVPLLGWVNQAMSGVRGWLVPAIAAALLFYALWMMVSGLLDRRRPRGPARSVDADGPGVRFGSSPEEGRAP